MKKQDLTNQIKKPNVFLQNYDLTSVNTSNHQTSFSEEMSSYQVNPNNHKVEWTSKITIDQSPRNIILLQIDYSIKSLINNVEMFFSIFNYKNKTWETIATEIHNNNVKITNPRNLISQHNDILIKLSFTSPSSFTLVTDYLNVIVVSYSKMNIERTLPTKINHELIEDNKEIVSYFKINTPVKRIHTLTFTLNTHNLHNVIILFYNYQKEVFTEVSKITNQELVVFSLTDQLEISNYISDSGQMKILISNASSLPLEALELLIEESPFESFNIAHISDIHELIGHEGFLAIIKELNTKIKPDFTIITGDVTDHGTKEQYQQYNEDILNFTNHIYTTPGNHDIRWWNTNGKNDFKEKIGPLYQSFDYQGIHFVLLDTTVTFELEGKLNKSQSKWLQEDLAKIPKEMPVIFFGHHPFRIGNDVTARDELLKIAKDYNLIGYLSGHMHNYDYHCENGIPIININCIKDNPNQEYLTILFTSRKYYLYQHKAIDSSKELWLSKQMNNIRKVDFDIKSINVLQEGNVEVQVLIKNAPDGVSMITARIDNYGPYTALSKISEKIWEGTIDISLYQPTIPNGKHFVGVELTDCCNGLWTKYANYQWEGSLFKTDWIYETDDLIQSSPTYFESKVYSGSSDHNLYCLNEANGKLLWKYTTNDAIISKPVIYHHHPSPVVIFGSHDKNLYALDAKTGKLVWSFATKGSVISDPLVHEEKVIFGSGDEFIYAVNGKSGQLIWRIKADGLMRQQPIVKDNILYAFVRNTYLWYAINLSNGKIVWRGNANTNESYFVCGDIKPIIVGDKLWCIDGQNFRVGYLSMHDGSLIWTSPIVGSGSRGMATDGESIYFLTNSGRQIHALNAKTNKFIWSTDLSYNENDIQENMVNCDLIYSNNKLIHVASRGRISIIDSLTGNRLSCYDASGYPENTFWSTPEVHGNSLYLTGIDGKIYKVSFK